MPFRFYSGASLGLGGALVIETSQSLPAMTSDSSPAGYTATSSSNFDSRFSAYMAFDQSNSTIWASAGPSGWVQRTVPSPIRVAKYRIRARADGGYQSQSPKNFTIKATNTSDNTNFTTIDTQVSSGWSAGEVREFTIPSANRGNYTTYRLDVTATDGSTDAVSFYELELLQEK